MEKVLNKQFLRLKDAIDEVLEAKNAGHAIELKQSATALMFVALKQANREVKRNIKSERDELHAEKSKVDLSRLHLQNLLYEVSHLKKEIVRCQKFKSRDTYLELLSDKEYSSKLGTDDEQTTDRSEHKTHLYRLECELGLRKELANQYSTLLKSKEELLQENHKQTQRYLSFGPALQTLLDSTKPLHDALQLTLDVEWKLSSIVKYLPRALYILFLSLESLQHANEPVSLKSEVVGFESDDQMQALLSKTENSLKGRRNFTETDDETEAPAGNVLERTLRPHPLHLRVVMENADKSYELVLYIYFWELLKCATVKAQLNSSNATNISGDANLLTNLLGHLYSNDPGNDLPVPGIEQELQNMKLSSKECLEYLSDNGYGKPYCWLQSMCAIPTIDKKKVYNHEKNLHKWTCGVFERLSKRWHCWLNLTQQIRGLTYKDVDLFTLKENIFKSGLSSSLVQWTMITIEEFNSQNSESLANIPVINGVTYTFYRAVIVRGAVKMECFIRIPSNYPISIPIWILSVHWNGCHTTMNNSAVKMMEAWTNSLLPSQLPKNHRLLYSQLYRTIYSFDVLVETESSIQLLQEYIKEKPYNFPFTKRIRLRPYRFFKIGSSCIFKQ